LNSLFDEHLNKQLQQDDSKRLLHLLQILHRHGWEASDKGQFDMTKLQLVVGLPAELQRFLGRGNDSVGTATVMPPITLARAVEAGFQSCIPLLVRPNPEHVRKAEDQLSWLQRRLKRRRSPVTDIFISGSFSRDTAIHPLKDIDCFAIVRSSEMFNSFHLFNTIFMELKDGGTSAEMKEPFTYLVTTKDETRLVVRRQHFSVGVCFAETWDDSVAKFDIVPALDRADGTYTILDRVTETKVITNPSASKKLVSDLDTLWRGRFVILVQLVKKWNNTQAVWNQKTGRCERPFKSFHLELMCCKFAPTLGSNVAVLGIHTVLGLLFLFLQKQFSFDIDVPGLPNPTYITAAGNSGLWTPPQIRFVVVKTFNQSLKQLELPGNGKIEAAAASAFGDMLKMKFSKYESRELSLSCLDNTIFVEQNVR